MMLDIKKYDEWIESSRVLQVRYISLLTAVLYFIYIQVDTFIIPSESLFFVQGIHLYLIFPMLLFISLLSFSKKHSSMMTYVLIFAPVGAALGNFIILSKLEAPTLYLTEIYLIIFWVFTVSGLRLFHACISAIVIFIISIFSISYLSYEEFLLHMFWVFSATSFGGLGAYLLESSSKKIFANKEVLAKLAVTDKLTGLYNRARFDEVLSHELSRSKRFNHPFSIVMIDIDYFKAVNDNFGHQVGDNILIEISRLIKENIRSTDVLVRWGGEEFILMCLETNLAGVKSLLENIRKKIEENSFPKVGKKTVSMGLTMYEKGDTDISILKRADKALYNAKANGRNCIEIVL